MHQTDLKLRGMYSRWMQSAGRWTWAVVAACTPAAVIRLLTTSSAREASQGFQLRRPYLHQASGHSDKHGR